MSESKSHIRLDDLALDWARIEEWCSHTSGRAIFGPVLERVEKAGRALEAERNELVEQLGIVQQERSLAGTRIRELEETLRTGGLLREELQEQLEGAIRDRNEWAFKCQRLVEAVEAFQKASSPFPQPALESTEKSLWLDREIPGKPADYVPASGPLKCPCCGSTNYEVKTSGDTWLTCNSCGYEFVDEDDVPELDMKNKNNIVQKFRKKPVVIEAIRWDGTEECLSSVLTWINFEILPDDGIHINKGVGYIPAHGTLDIPTLEGTMIASPGDWIIKGVKGEFYPCKPDIFEATYEPYED